MVRDRDWLAIRHAARRQDWAEVSRRAEALGWPLVAKRARRCVVDSSELPNLVWALRLDLPDEFYQGAADA